MKLPTILLLMSAATCKLSLAEGEGTPSFVMAFQSSRNISVNEWARYRGVLPQAMSFTVCHWDYLTFFSPSSTNIWGYCMRIDGGPRIKCLQLWYVRDTETAGRTVELNVGFGSDRVGAKVGNFDQREWNHLCWTHDHPRQRHRLYVNGELVRTTNASKASIGFGYAGGGRVLDSAFVIGQEQDEVGAKYDKMQAFQGKLTELNAWDYELEEGDVKGLAGCRVAMKGNLIAWREDSFVTQGIGIEKLADRRLVCRREVRLAVFPQKRSLSRADTLCRSFGGSIASPLNKVENDRFDDRIGYFILAWRWRLFKLFT